MGRNRASAGRTGFGAGGLGAQAPWARREPWGLYAEGTRAGLGRVNTEAEARARMAQLFPRESLWPWRNLPTRYEATLRTGQIASLYPRSGRVRVVTPGP